MGRRFNSPFCPFCTEKLLGAKDPLRPRDPTDHHITPSSRFESKSKSEANKEENILHGLSHLLHVAYHVLFGNRNPYEVLDALVRFLFKPGLFRDYPRSIKKKEPLKVLPPDDLMLEIINRIFPEDWIPGNRLMGELEKRRRNGSTKLTINEDAIHDR